MDESTMLREVFAAALKRRRVLGGWTQADLAAKAGLEQSYISLLERGDRAPGLDTFIRLSRALGVKPVTFLSQIEKLLGK